MYLAKFLDSLTKKNGFVLIDANKNKYNLISGMHSFLSDADNCFNNILPPLSLLDLKEKEKLFEELNKLDFNSKFLKVA